MNNKINTLEMNENDIAIYNGLLPVAYMLVKENTGVSSLICAEVIRDELYLLIRGV